MRAASVVLSVWLLALSGDAIAQAQRAAAVDWLTFSGSWSATGRRQTMPTEQPRAAAIIRLSGAVVLTNATSLSRAFQAEAIGFDDATLVATGRAVWTDTQGDRIFSTLKGDALATGRRVAGTITGGTGRYAAAAGDWELTWQFVVETEDGEVQGRASDLRGRIRGVEARR